MRDAIHLVELGLEQRCLECVPTGVPQPVVLEVVDQREAVTVERCELAHVRSEHWRTELFQRNPLRTCVHHLLGLFDPEGRISALISVGVADHR